MIYYLPYKIFIIKSISSFSAMIFAQMIILFYLLIRVNRKQKKSTIKRELSQYILLFDLCS